MGCFPDLGCQDHALDREYIFSTISSPVQNHMNFLLPTDSRILETTLFADESRSHSRTSKPRVSRIHVQNVLFTKMANTDVLNFMLTPKTVATGSTAA